MKNITSAEMEIMRIIWNSDEKITTRKLAEKLPDKKITTISTLAGRLINKGFLKSEKIGRSHVHQYSVLISEKEYQEAQTKNFMDSIHDGSATSLISALFNNKNLSKKDIDELREFINREGEQN